MKKLCLFDNYCEGFYSYDYYLEHCEINDIQPKERDSADYWEFINDMLEEDWECLLDNIKYGNSNLGLMLCYGVLDRWDGKKTICPCIKEDLVDTIKFCSQGYDAVQIYLDNGVIEIHGLHHDGTDIIYIRPINEKRIGNKSNDDICNSKNPTWYCKLFPKYIY